jgi:hypothetical protein
MRPIVTVRTSGEHGVVFTGPPGVGDLHAYRVHDGERVGVRTIWEPTDEERRAIANGCNLALTFWGRMPPTALELADDDEQGVGEDDTAVRRRLEALRS